MAAMPMRVICANVRRPGSGTRWQRGPRRLPNPERHLMIAYGRIVSRSIMGVRLLDPCQGATQARNSVVQYRAISPTWKWNFFTWSCPVSGNLLDNHNTWQKDLNFFLGEANSWEAQDSPTLPELRQRRAPESGHHKARKAREVRALARVVRLIIYLSCVDGVGLPLSSCRLPSDMQTIIQLSPGSHASLSRPTKSTFCLLRSQHFKILNLKSTPRLDFSKDLTSIVLELGSDKWHRPPSWITESLWPSCLSFNQSKQVYIFKIFNISHVFILQQNSSYILVDI